MAAYHDVSTFAFTMKIKFFKKNFNQDQQCELLKYLHKIVFRPIIFVNI